jgi:hypothetical protein
VAKPHLLRGLWRITVMYLLRNRWVNPSVRTGLRACFLVSRNKWFRITWSGLGEAEILALAECRDSSSLFRCSWDGSNGGSLL